MSTKKKETANVPEPTKEQILDAAVNNPSNTIEVAGKSFEVKDFTYKQYIQFVKYLAPMFDMFIGKSQLSIDSLGNKLDAMAILTFCEDDLPKMALMVAHHSYPEMTEEELLELMHTPFELATLVLAQIAHNKIIESLAGFLKLMTGK